MILIIDNYDSFTYNLYQYIAQLGYSVTVLRNDAVTVEEIAAHGYTAIILSPGPGTPDDAGITKDVIRRLAGQTPIFGVCLGHQSIGEVFGGKVVRAPQPVHGKVSEILHTGRGLYQGMPSPLAAGRYHSLIVERDTLPECLEITAETSDGIIMGLRHRELDVEGVQFHPESVLTEQGLLLIQNFLSRISQQTKPETSQQAYYVLTRKGTRHIDTFIAPDAELEACRAVLSRFYPDAVLQKSATSTEAAYRVAGSSGNQAVIGSRRLAELFGLEVVLPELVPGK